MFSASAKLPVRLIKFFVVLPPNAILSPTLAASILILSQLISPTFVMLLSPNDNAPAKAVIVVVPIVPPLTTSPLMESLGNSMVVPIIFPKEPVDINEPLILVPVKFNNSTLFTSK